RPYRPAHRTRAREAVPRPDAALPRRQAERGRFPRAAAAQRPVHPALRADAAHRDPLRPALDAPAAQARRHLAQLRPRLRALLDAPEPAAQLATPGAGPR